MAATRCCWRAKVSAAAVALAPARLASSPVRPTLGWPASASRSAAVRAGAPGKLGASCVARIAPAMSCKSPYCASLPAISLLVGPTNGAARLAATPPVSGAAARSALPPTGTAAPAASPAAVRASGLRTSVYSASAAGAAPPAPPAAACIPSCSPMTLREPRATGDCTNGAMARTPAPPPAAPTAPPTSASVTGAAPALPMPNASAPA